MPFHALETVHGPPTVASPAAATPTCEISNNDDRTVVVSLGCCATIAAVVLSDMTSQ